MNQGEATATIIDYVREQAPDDKRVQRALKVLEKRYDVLRSRAERRQAAIPEDLFSEPLTLSPKVIVADLAVELCRCGRAKEARTSLCPQCFRRLAPGSRKALWLRVGDGHEHAYCRALRELGIPTSKGSPSLYKGLISAYPPLGKGVSPFVETKTSDFEESLEAPIESCSIDAYHLRNGVNAPAREVAAEL